MPSIPFGTSSYERARGDLPALPMVNMVAEEAPTETKGLALQSRPGLSDRAADMGSGPVKALFQADGVLGGALFGLSGDGLYKGTARLGSVYGDGPAKMAGYGTALFATQGVTLSVWNGSTLSPVAFPDGASVSSVVVGASRLIALRKGTGQFYWSDPLSTTIEALNFATAENQPDRLLDMLFVDDILILFGAETIEFWPNTNDPELPFQPLEGRVIERGIRATGCAVTFAGSFAWVTNEHNVCVQSETNVLSNPGLQARIEASATCSLFTFLLDGVEYLALRLDNETQVYSGRAQRWSEFTSHGRSNWLPSCFAKGVFGSGEDGRTLAWADNHLDLGGVLERRLRGGFPINSNGQTINNVQVRCNVGQTGFLTGDYADPSMEMRVSRDAGKTWGSWRSAALGSQGSYRSRVQWRSCGMASQPAFLAEFRVTAPVDLRVSDVLVNEPGGGR